MGLTDRLRHPGLMRQRAAGLALAAVIGLLAVSATLAAPPGKPHAWFDAPLPGATLPLAAYKVVVHAADESGVAKVRFQVDGTPAATQAPSGPGDLVVVSWNWAPASEGAHLITAVAEGIDGSLSDPVAVGVIVDADAGALPTPDISPAESASGEPTATPLASGATPGPSPTPRVTGTPAPTSVPTATPGPTSVPTATPRPTPTPPPCVPSSPNLVAPADRFEVVGSDPTENPPTFTWQIDVSCNVSGFHVVITDADGATIDERFVGPSVRSWTPASALPGTRDCVFPQYYWSVWAQVTGVDQVQSATRQFAVCG